MIFKIFQGHLFIRISPIKTNFMRRWMNNLINRLKFSIMLIGAFLLGAWAINFRILHQETNPILVSLAVFAFILSGLIFDKKRKTKK